MTSKRPHACEPGRRRRTRPGQAISADSHHVAGGFGSGHALSLAICRVWDLLWVSDSTGSGGVPEAYVRRIEADLGVAVRVHDAWKPSLAAKTVLTTLRGANGGVLFSAGSGKANLPELVREAEVIVVSGNPVDSPTAGHPWDCDCSLGFDPNPRCGVVTSCGPERWAQYEMNLEATFDETFALRDGRRDARGARRRLLRRVLRTRACPAAAQRVGPRRRRPPVGG